MKKKIGVIHCVAICKDCGKVFDNYKNAQALAAQHCRKYGHTVNGEVGIAFTYEPKEERNGI